MRELAAIPGGDVAPPRDDDAERGVPGGGGERRRRRRRGAAGRGEGRERRVFARVSLSRRGRDDAERSFPRRQGAFSPRRRGLARVESAPNLVELAKDESSRDDRGGMISTGFGARAARAGRVRARDRGERPRAIERAGRDAHPGRLGRNRGGVASGRRDGGRRRRRARTVSGGPTPVVDAAASGRRGRARARRWWREGAGVRAGARMSVRRARRPRAAAGARRARGVEWPMAERGNTNRRVGRAPRGQPPGVLAISVGCSRRGEKKLRLPPGYFVSHCRGRGARVPPARLGSMSDQAKLRGLYAKASSLLERWSAAHSRASALYASAASIHERLPLMDDDSRFGALAARDAALPGRARDAQADALDGVMTALAAELATFRALATALEKLRRDAETLAQRAAPAHAGAARLGPAPSVAERSRGSRISGERTGTIRVEGRARRGTHARRAGGGRRRDRGRVRRGAKPRPAGDASHTRQGPAEGPRRAMMTTFLLVAS